MTQTEHVAGLHQHCQIKLFLGISLNYENDKSQGKLYEFS